MELHDGWIYQLEDGTMVEAREIEPGRWQLWSIDDKREFEIQQNGDIISLPCKVGSISHLSPTGLGYNRETRQAYVRGK